MGPSVTIDSIPHEVFCHWAMYDHKKKYLKMFSKLLKLLYKKIFQILSERYRSHTLGDGL